MKNIYKILFLIIFALAVFFRFWHLSSLPPSLNWDEISHGYNAYSLLTTGKDQWGISWPIFNFRAYGDYPTTLNLYLTIPFIKFMGLNALSIRMPSAIFGIIFVVLVFFFARLVFKDDRLALLSMFIASLSPWGLFPSRAVFQSNFSQTLLLAGLVFFYHGLKKPRQLIYASISFGLSMYAYHNTRIIIPLLLPVLIYFNRHSLHHIFKTHRLLSFTAVAVFLLLTVPNLINLFSPESTARNRWVGIINPNSVNLINEKRRLFTGPQFLNLALNNKVVYFSQTVFLNYLSLINPLPLFFQGSQNYQFNPPSTGLLFLVFLPFFYLGLIKIVKLIPKSSFYRQFALGFLITLLPSALTVGDFPSIRATTALPFYILTIVLGLSYLQFSKLNAIFYLVILISLLEFANYWRQYLSYSQNYSSAWQYGYQSVVDYLKPNYQKYSRIYVTKKYGEPHEFILFYWPWNPAAYQSDSALNWNYHADWYWVDSFDKFTFLNDWEIKDQKFPANSLLITSPQNYPATGSALLQTVDFLDSTPAFDIVSYD